MSPASNPAPTYSNYIDLLPVELKIMVMVELKDLDTLRSLIEAVPSVGDVFVAQTDIVLGTVLERSVQEELREYLYAILSARAAGPLVKKDLQIFLDNHLERTDTTQSPPRLPRSRDTLYYITNVLSATDFFVEFCIRVFARGRSGPIFLPPRVATERFHIRRALLRFQLYCELFHQPGDSSDSVSDWEERFPEQELFWTRCEWWEVEECKCIYYLLILCLKTDPGSRSAGFAKGSLQCRGLPQFRDVIEQVPPTEFGSSYIRRFQEKALQGFANADPDDLGYFSRRRYDYRSQRADFVSEQKRRWKASPTPWETVEDFADPVRKGWAKFDNNQEARSYVRLLGWCFWEWETLFALGLFEDVNDCISDEDRYIRSAGYMRFKLEHLS